MQTIHKGTALITALFIMTLVAAAGSIMMLREHVAIHRTEQVIQGEQAYCYEHLVIAWAKAQIQLMQQNPNNQPSWPIIFPEQAYSKAIISGEIDDAQGTLNLNAVTTSQGEVLQRLMQNLMPSLKETDRQIISSALSAWVTSNSNNSDGVYLSLDPPYRAAHQLLAHPSEWRLVNGVSSDVYLKLQPYVTALPEATPINVNSAPAAVLMALNPQINISAVMDYRKSHGSFNSMQTFYTIAQIAPLAANLADITTHYYFCKAKVKIDKRTYVLYSLLQFQQDTVATLWESQGSI